MLKWFQIKTTLLVKVQYTVNWVLRILLCSPGCQFFIASSADIMWFLALNQPPSSPASCIRMLHLSYVSCVCLYWTLSGYRHVKWLSLFNKIFIAHFFSVFMPETMLSMKVKIVRFHMYFLCGSIVCSSFPRCHVFSSCCDLSFHA
jgi:hypothetical protein